ncbi:MAG: flagellar basal body-associated FliL family protein, partial [Bacillota bacterium]
AVTLILVVVVVAVVVGGGLFLVLGRKGGGKRVVVKTFRVGEVSTNLADPSSKRFVKVVLEVEVDGDKPLRELQKQSSAVRDAVLSVLRAKTLTEVQGADGMARLAGDLSGAIGKFLTKGKVLKVNFLEFMTQ